MGVELTNYVVAGYYYPYPEFRKLTENTFFDDNSDKFDWGKVDLWHDNAHKKTIENPIVIIDDGMCGKYCFIGKILRKWDYGSVEPLNCQLGKKESNKIKKEIKAKLIEYGLVFPEKEFGVYTFSHHH